MNRRCCSSLRSRKVEGHDDPTVAILAANQPASQCNAHVPLSTVMVASSVSGSGAGVSRTSEAPVSDRSRNVPSARRHSLEQARMLPGNSRRVTILRHPDAATAHRR
jgi:hypothetical protein